MKPARCYVGDMLTGLIIVEALLIDDEIDKLLEREERWTDLLIKSIIKKSFKWVEVELSI